MRVHTHETDWTPCRVYLDGEDVSDYCQAADEEWGVVILFETEPGNPTSRITDWERKELKRCARIGHVRILPVEQEAENA